MPIYTRQGVLKYEQDLLDLVKQTDKLPPAQQDRKRDDKIRFHNCDFNRLNLRGHHFDGVVFDQTDWEYADLTGSTFYKCGFREVNMFRTVIEGCVFENCNFREGRIAQCFGEGSVFKNNMMISVDMRKSHFMYSEFVNNDMRKANLRDADMSECLMQGNKMRGWTTRNTQFSHSSVPKWFNDPTQMYAQMDPESVHYAYKLTAADGKGIYQPLIRYEVGKEFDCEYQDGKYVPYSPKFNTGIAIADMSWVLREWVLCGAYPDYKLFRVSFKAGDVITHTNGGKFNVKKIRVEEEIDLQPYYEDLNEDAPTESRCGLHENESIGLQK